MPYEGYVRKKYKHVPSEGYFYLTRQLKKFMMRAQNMSNLHRLVRAQNMSMQKISNSHAFSIDEN